MRRPRKMYIPERPAEGRILAGVCAGISRALAVDVTLVRLAFMILGFAWGLGVMLYGALWLFMPDPSRGATPDGGWRAMVRHRVGDMRVELRNSARSVQVGWQRAGQSSWPRPIGRRWLAVGFISAGLLAFLTSIGLFSWITPMRAISLALILFGLAALLSLRGPGR
ncbi:MAG: PspC domain-containing protein [Proteobacteria bacterium]|nr:PspC domain-containing protein [Pseudomonadota bacterium]